MTVFGSDDRISSNYNNVFKGLSNLGNFTGSLVKSDLVLSVAHAVQGLGSYVTFETTSGKIVGKAVFWDEYDDIAIFQLEKQLNITPFNLTTPTQDLLNFGTTLVGYHGDRPGQAKVFSRNSTLLKQTNELVYDHDAIRGSSGGPLLDINNNLIGVNHSQNEYNNIGTGINEELTQKIQELDNLVKGSVVINNSNSILEEGDIVRFLDKKTGAHVYTDDVEKIQSLGNNSNFIGEDVWKNSGENDVYEFYNPESNDYLYTSDLYEISVVQATLKDYKFNGSVFGVEDNTIYRLYNPSNGLHFYTDNHAEAQNADLNLGFDNEGFL
jgi:Repeat of unknown function (DUF5648)/Trypsin-like peptidase domain